MTFQEIKYFALTKSYGQYINLLSVNSAVKASEKAFELFSQPRKGKLQLDKIPEILLDAEFETFIYDENQYQMYIWKGSDEIILLVHGWESNTSRWKKLLPFLKETGKTIVAIDAPAHGLSTGIEFTVPTYAKVIAELTKIYNPKYIIGHSIGGAASIYYQFLNQNANVEKMILLGTPSDLQVLINNFCEMLSLNDKVKTELENQFSSRFKMKIEDFSGAKFANHIATKTLIVHDNQDTVVSILEAKKLASNWKNSQFIVTDDLGHGMNNKKLYQKIVAFLLETND